MRTTPWRSLLIAGVDAGNAQALGEKLSALEMIADPTDQRRRIFACVGAPACQSASVDARGDASRIAAAFRTAGAETIHVSGCEKSCARQEAADVTLVHGADGLRLAFGRDVAGTLLTRPVSLDVALEQLAQRFVRAASASSPGKSTP